MNAQTSDPRTAAEAVAREALAALDAREWNRVAELMHPQALEAIRSQTLNSIRSMLRHREESSQWPRDPNMPEAVAAWFEEQGRKQLAAYDPLRPYGVESIEELETLSPREFLVRHLEAEDPRTQVRIQMEAMGKEPPAVVAAHLAEGFRTHHTVVGSVAENDTTVLVLVRRGEGLALEAIRGWGRELTVVTVRRDGDEWRIWPVHGPFDPFTEFSTSVFVTWTDENAYDDLAKRVVAWPDSTAPEGLAYVVGYSPEERTVRGLVIELTRPGGEPIRIEIPASAFRDLFELLQIWAYTQDPE